MRQATRSNKPILSSGEGVFRGLQQFKELNDSTHTYSVRLSIQGGCLGFLLIQDGMWFSGAVSRYFLVKKRGLH